VSNQSNPVCYTNHMATATTKARGKMADLKLRAYVAESVREVLDDPDFGLELSDDFRRRLHLSEAKPQKYTPLATVMKRLRKDG